MEYLKKYKREIYNIKILIYRKEKKDKIISSMQDAGYDRETSERLVDYAEMLIKNEEIYEKSLVRNVGFFVLIFGFCILGLSYYLSQTDIPSARYGRLLLGFLLGLGASLYGLWLIVTGRDTDWF